MEALIDGDILVYRTGYTVNEEGTEGIARARMNETITSLLSDVNARSFRIFLSDSKNNFRRKIFPEYKANRKDQPKPIHYEFLINILLKSWDAEVAFDEEADDALGINQRVGKTIICSIDKDLHQIPGHHYNWVTKNSRYITPMEAMHNFYAQVLTGDTTDNVCTGTNLACPGIGKVKAWKALEGCQTEEEYFHTTAGLFVANCPGDVESSYERMVKTAQLIKIRQKEGEIWTPPFKYNFVVASKP